MSSVLDNIGRGIRDYVEETEKDFLDLIKKKDISKFRRDGRTITIVHESEIRVHKDYWNHEKFGLFEEENFIAKNKLRIRKCLNHLILKICESDNRFKQLPNITVVYQPNLFGSTARRIKNKYVVFLGVSLNFLPKNRGKMEAVETEKFRRSLFHELIHLWHEHIASALSKLVEYVARVEAVLNKEKADLRELFTEKDLLKGMRYLLMAFFLNLFMEGIAYYSEEVSEGKMPFESKKWKKLYRTNFALANKIKRKFAKNVVNKELKKAYFFNDLDPYLIGAEMVFTILYVEYRDIETIAKMNWIQFVKTYEQSFYIITNQFGEGNWKPLVSFSSNKGILDYQWMLDLVYKTWKEKKIRR